MRPAVRIAFAATMDQGASRQLSGFPAVNHDDESWNQLRSITITQVVNQLHATQRCIAQRRFDCPSAFNVYC
jgi:hypothetical protein